MSARTAVPVAPAVLRWARESSGTSIEEAARRIQQEPAVLLEWESETGERQPTLGALTELAALYDRPISVFLLDTPPSEEGPPPDLRAATGHEVRPLSRPTLLAVRHARRAQRLVGEIRQPGSWRRPQAFPGDFSPSSIEDLAASSRELLGVSLETQASWPGKDAAFTRWRTALERTGVLVVQADLPLEDVRAFSLPGDPPVIVINEHDFPASRVFSLFHELGHVLFGAGAICAPLARRPTSAVERACDLFAGSLLVPRAALSEAWAALHQGRRTDVPGSEVTRLAGHFNVSAMVIWYRLRQAGLVSTEVFRARWDEWWLPVKRPTRTANPPRIAAWQKTSRRLGSRLSLEIIQAEDRGDISLGEALRTLDIRVQDVEKLRSATS